jgi:hypothetical protein
MVLYENWKDIAKKAWSFRLMALAGIFTTLEIVLPLYSDAIPRGVFAAFTFLAVTGGMISRLVAQKGIKS